MMDGGAFFSNGEWMDEMDGWMDGWEDLSVCRKIQVKIGSA